MPGSGRHRRLKRPAFVCTLALVAAGFAVHVWLGVGTAGPRSALAQATAPAAPASEWSRLAGPPAYPPSSTPDAPLSQSDLALAVGVVGDLGFFFIKLADTDPNPLAGQIWRAAGQAYSAGEGALEAALQQGRLRVSNEALDRAVQHRGDTFVVAPRLAGDWAAPAAEVSEGRKDGWPAAANLASHLIGAWVEGDPAQSAAWFQRHETVAGLGRGASVAGGGPRRADLARYWVFKDLFLRAGLLRIATELPGQRGLWSVRESQIETRLSVFLDRLAGGAGPDRTARLRADWAAYRAETARLASERVWLLLGKRRPEPAVPEAAAEPQTEPANPEVASEQKPEPQPEPVPRETIAAAAPTGTAPDAPEATGASAEEIAAIEQAASAEAAALQSEIDRLQQALDERERETALLSAQLAAAERSAEAAWQEADAAAGEAEQARQQTLQLEAERDEARVTAQGEADALRTQTETRSRELEAARTEAAAARQAVVLAETERQAAQDRAAGLTQELAAAESARATAEAEAAQALRDAETTRTDIGELREAVVLAETERQAAQDRAASLTQELAAAESARATAEAEADAAATAQEAGAAETAALQGEFAALRQELTALKTEAAAADAEAAEQIRTLQQDLNVKDEALARSQRDLAGRSTTEQPAFLERWQELLAAAVILIGLPLVFLASWIGRTRAAERVPAGLPVQATPAPPAAPQPIPITAAAPVAPSGHGSAQQPPPATAELLAEALRNGDWAHADRCFAALTGLKSPRLGQLLSNASSEDLAMACRAAGLDRLTFANLYLTARNGEQGGATTDPKALSDAVRLFDDTDQDAAQARLAARQNGEAEADSRS